MRYKWTVVPATTSVITRVHTLADELKLKNKITNHSPITISNNRGPNKEYDNNKIEEDTSTFVNDQTTEQGMSDLAFDINNSKSNYVTDNLSKLSISQKSK